jgi:uncharacterized protein (TIGR03435 family)
MNRRTLSLLAVAACAGSAFAQTQDMTGAWQGTLQAGGREIRIVIKVAKGDAGALKATMYSIDQGGPALPASSFTAQGAIVKMAIPAVGGAYEGKLDPDGSTIAGTWSQGGAPLPLILKRATPGTAWAIPEPPPPPKPMDPNADPVFEVATIKPGGDNPGKVITIRGRHFITVNTTLSDLVGFAYGLHPKQVTNAPAWFESDRFDLDAQPEGAGQPSEKQWKTMLQKLIVDRFQLKFHRDKKELTVYAIVLGKGGPKLTKSDASAGSLPGLFFRGPGNLPVRNATIADLARTLQAVVLDRPVVDQTGLTDRYDFTLLWTPDEFQFNGAFRGRPANDAADAPPDLYTAVQQQLGLKIEGTKAPAEVLVIDKVEKPSAN